jgi:pyridoxal phosphate enzyme (YggS family)
MTHEIRERLGRVRDRIAQAATRSGRRPEEITLIAVTKTFDVQTIQQAVDAGAHDLGENRVQEALAKKPNISGTGLRWHLIGNLQSNKARQAAGAFDFIHSIDSTTLVDRLNRIAGELGRRPAVLIQVNVGHETTKSGIDETDLQAVTEAVDHAANLDFRGLMAIPPFSDDVEQTRPYFRRLRQLLEDLNAKRPHERRLSDLSMGMSHDFEVAIEEGATMVRVGTAIFGARAAGVTK